MFKVSYGGMTSLPFKKKLGNVYLSHDNIVETHIRNHRSTGCAKFLRQSVSLTGLGTPTFDASMQGMLDVYAFFSSHVTCDSMKSCKNCHNYGDNTTIELSNRYFSPVRKMATENCVPFSKDVDPYGILGCLESANNAHCDVNVVEYYNHVARLSGSLRR